MRILSRALKTTAENRSVTESSLDGIEIVSESRAESTQRQRRPRTLLSEREHFQRPDLVFHALPSIVSRVNHNYGRVHLRQTKAIRAISAMVRNNERSQTVL